MNTSQKTAIILGATGLTGGVLLELLLADTRYGKVKLFSRSPIGRQHPKLEEHLGDLLTLGQFRDDYHGDEVYCCIGTTNAKTPDKTLYRKIDYGIPVAAAKLARENKVPTFIVMSSLGANPGSRVFYSRTKGQMEAAVCEAGVSRTYILRPSVIAGKRGEVRPGEWVIRQLMKALNVVLAGPLARYRSISPEDIARCMIWLANHAYETTLIPSDEIREIAQKSMHR